MLKIILVKDLLEFDRESATASAQAHQVRYVFGSFERCGLTLGT